MSEVVDFEEKPEAVGEGEENELVRSISDMRSDLDRIVPHIIRLMRRDEEEHRQRLDSLEKRARELPTWPIAIGVHEFMERMRRTEMSDELLESIQVELNDLLAANGFRPFGRSGQEFRADRHEVTGASMNGAGPWEVDEVIRRGLVWVEQVVQRAAVTVVPVSVVERIKNDQ